MIGNQENTAEQDSSTVTSLEIGVQIKQFILERFPAFVGTSLDATTPLLEDGEIDSLGAIELVNFLEESFDIEMEDEDFVPENLETISALSELVISKLDK